MRKNKKRKIDEGISFQSTEIKRKVTTNDDYKMIERFIVVLIVMGILGLLLFIFNGKYVTKDMFNEKTTTTTKEPAYNESKITVSNIFKMKDAHYYVLLYSSEDNIAFVYDGFVSGYSNKNVPLYTVDMNEVFNKKYYNEKGVENKTPKRYEDLVITKPTLIEINKGKVVSYISDKETILEKLK